MMKCRSCSKNWARAGLVACGPCRSLALARGASARAVSVEVRLWGRLAVVGECWEYQGARGADGYGAAIAYNGKQVRPHLLALILAKGDERPGGLECDHLCHNRACARPDHLRWATRLANLHNRQRPLMTTEEKDAKWRKYMRGYHARQKAAGKVRTSSGAWVPRA